MDFSANQSYKSERKSVCLTVCAFFAFVRFVKPYRLSLAYVYYITIIAFGNTLKPNCRCSTAAYSDREEYEEWLDFLDKGGTTAEYEKLKAKGDKTLGAILAASVAPKKAPKQSQEQSQSQSQPQKETQLTEYSDNGKITSGAISGARNPFSDEAKEHAKKYYGLIRSMKTDVSKISKTTGISEKDVQTIKDFIFNEKHDLGGPELEYFEPDYMMAESWQRLISGQPEPHDITLLKHELMEKELMSQGLTQEKAHIETSKKYNYSKEVGEYYAEIEKHKTK